MGGGGQPKNTTTTTETKIPDWLATDYQQFLGQAQTANDKPYQAYTSPLNAGMSEGQTSAYINAINNSRSNPAQYQALAGLVAGNQNVNATPSPYSGQNPYLDSVIGNSNKDVTDAYNQNAVPALAAQFSQGGAFGGSAMAQASADSQKQLANTLSNQDTQLRYQDYTDQANRWQQGFQNQLAASQNNSQNILGASQALNGQNALAAQWNSQLAGLGQVQQDYQQGNINQDYNNWYQQNYGYDQQKLNNYGNALNAASGNFTGSSTTGANPAYQPRTAGGALAAAGSGAAMGAALGTAFPVVGNVIGGVVGGVAGAASYYL